MANTFPKKYAEQSWVTHNVDQKKHNLKHFFIISQPVFITTKITFLPQTSLQVGSKCSNTFFLPAAELTITSFLLTWSNQLAKPNKCATIHPSEFKTGLNTKPGQDVNSQDPANGSNSLTQDWVLNANWPIIRVHWACCTNGDIKAYAQELGSKHQYLWGLFMLFWNNLDIKSSQTSLSSCDLSPMKCSQIVPWQSVHPGGCLPSVCTSPWGSGDQPKILILPPELQPHVIRCLQKDYVTKKEIFGIYW